MPDVPANANVPTSGAISVQDFYGANNELFVEVTATQVNLDIATLFPSADWTSAINKRVQINSSVTIGSNSTGNPALTVPSNYGGTVYLDNNGSIEGAGGNGGVGGNAIQVANGNPTQVDIDNQGTIYRGGGGGGTGGTGGNSSCPPTSSPGPCRSGGGGCGFCPGCGGGCSGCGCNCVNQCGPGICFFVAQCSCPQSNPQPPSAGGAGGAGGRGQGYDGNATNGQSGSGSNRCGSGGSGGAGGRGGDFGVAGNSGSPGGNGNQSSGGSGGSGFAAGNYISGVANVNWVNLGTVAGNTA